MEEYWKYLFPWTVGGCHSRLVVVGVVTYLQSNLHHPAAQEEAELGALDLGRTNHFGGFTDTLTC